MRRWFTRIVVVAVVIGIGAVAFMAIAWRSALPVESSASKRFEPGQVVRGAQLAAIGNCNTCHTTADSQPYAGGRPIVTPFGTVYATNITPDPETGIGGWSEAAFTRAMRDGVSRDGHHLYPAFPYDHMTRMHEADISAVYAFIMTRRPMRAATPENDLPFPLNIRALVAGWKLLFLDRGVKPEDNAKSTALNRGAYLVKGLGHCGACHTPRNFLGAEKRGQAYAGGESEGWIAPALNAASPAAVPWDAERLHRYLRDGFDDLHGVAAGPMAPVARNLAAVPDEDVFAIATYVASVAGTPSPERRAAAANATARTKGEAAPRRGADASSLGAAIYVGACAQCHGEAGRAPTLPALNLALSSTLRNPRPNNVLRIVREGIHPPDGQAGPLMPGFADVLTDVQLIDLVAYLRAEFSDGPPWTRIDDALRQVKQAEADKMKAAQSARSSK